MALVVPVEPFLVEWELLDEPFAFFAFVLVVVLVGTVAVATVVAAGSELLVVLDSFVPFVQRVVASENHEKIIS